MKTFAQACLFVCLVYFVVPAFPQDFLPLPSVVEFEPTPAPSVPLAKPVPPTKLPIKSIVVGPVSNGHYDGTSKWTYPGDIASHLSTVHRQRVDGLTKDAMEKLHDQLHAGTRYSEPVYFPPQPATRNPQPSLPPQPSACPGGVCPAPSPRNLQPATRNLQPTYSPPRYRLRIFRR